VEGPSGDSASGEAVAGGDVAGVGEAIAGGDSLLLFLCNWCSFFLDNGRPLSLGFADGVTTVDVDVDADADADDDDDADDDTLTPDLPPFLFGPIRPMLVLLLLLLLLRVPPPMANNVRRMKWN
jgi:hypothetical protein